MSYNVQLNPSKCLQMEPLVLVDILQKDLTFQIPEDVTSIENQKIAANTLTKATSFATFFSDLEMKAKLLKRKAKANKETQNAERYLGLEEVFKTYKDISKLQITNITRLMTLRRLDLDEQKNMGRMT